MRLVMVVIFQCFIEKFADYIPDTTKKKMERINADSTLADIVRRSAWNSNPQYLNIFHKY